MNCQPKCGIVRIAAGLVHTLSLNRLSDPALVSEFVNRATFALMAFGQFVQPGRMEMHLGLRARFAVESVRLDFIVHQAAHILSQIAVVMRPSTVQKGALPHLRFQKESIALSE